MLFSLKVAEPLKYSCASASGYLKNSQKRCKNKGVFPDP